MSSSEWDNMSLGQRITTLLIALVFLGGILLWILHGPGGGTSNADSAYCEHLWSQNSNLPLEQAEGHDVWVKNCVADQQSVRHAFKGVNG